MSQRVFITGYSALTASGKTAQETWEAVKQGQSYLTEITEWDLSSWSCHIGGVIQDLQPARLLPDRKLMKVISKQDVLGLNAAMQAVEQSQLISFRDQLSSPESFNDRTGIYVGSPGNKYYQQYDFLSLLAKTDGEMKPFAKQLFDEIHPMWLLRILPNNVLAYTGITYGFKGPNHNITNHAVGGMQAIIEAYHAIQMRQADRAVVVAYDIAIEPQAMYYYDKLGVLSPNDLKPFDSAHDGTVLGDGAAAFVIESEASVNARSAVCYGEIAGGAIATEAAGLFSIEDDGASLSTLMHDVLQRYQISIEEVGFVVAHGNGNKKSDISEAQAIQRVFKNQSMPVTAFKWSMGHTICASGLLDAVLATQALQEKCIPGIANFSDPALDCAGLNVSKDSQSIGDQKSCAVVINRGFASMNACLVIKACD